MPSPLALPWSLYTELVVARGHPTFTDVDNRALRQLLTNSGYNPDSIFTGFQGPLFNVKAYGALGDGVADDTAAIQLTVTAAGVAPGAEVFFPPGTYLVSSAIAVPNFARLVGSGIASLLRASGNTFILDLNPANRAHIENLYFDAASVQNSAGGAIDFRNAGQNIRLHDLYFGNNLYNSLFIAPTAGSMGIYFLDRLRWNFVTGCQNGIVIGNGTNLITDVYLSHLVGSGLTTGGMAGTWIQILNNSDSVVLSDTLFFQGTSGINVGQNAANNVTGCKFTNVVVDTMSVAQGGVQFNKCRDFKVTNLSIQTCVRGLDIGANATDLSIVGGTIQNNTANGVTAFAGATRFDLIGLTVNTNNTANGAFGQGIEIAPAVSDWRVAHCRIGNFGIAGGHQKWGLIVDAGASNTYSIIDNTFAGNETGAISDGGNGAVRWANQFSTGLSQGRAVLVGGTVTVNTAEIQTGDNVQLTRVVQGGTAHGDLEVGTLVAGTSFVINAKTVLNALEANDTSTIFWQIVH